MAKKEVKNREYLAKILYQFNYIGEDGAVEEGRKGDSEMCQLHNGFYVIAPDIIRRCYFLSCIEKEVLWELFSWASNDGGYCSVSQKIISLNTNIAESTVKKTINELYNKGFIEKRRTTRRRNLYKIADVSKNSYVLLSEYIHYRLKIFLSEEVNNNEKLYENNLGCNVSFSVDAFVAGIKKFVKTPKLYMPFVEELEMNEGNFIDTYEQVIHEVGEVIIKCYGNKAQEILKKYPHKYSSMTA